MNRSLARGSPAGRGSGTYQLDGDPSVHSPANGKSIEEWRSHGDSLSSPGAPGLTTGQFVQDHLSPPKPHLRNGDSGISNGAMNYSSSPDILKSLGSSPSSSGQPRIKRAYAVSLSTSMMLCFLSAFIFIGMLGSRSPAYNLRLVPTLGIYRSHRRLQAEVVVDPFKGGVFGKGSVRMKELPICESSMEDSVPCYDAFKDQELELAAGEGYVRQCEAPSKRKQCLTPPPDEYRIPPRWPASNDGVWSKNMKLIEQYGLSGRRLARLKLGADDIVTLDMGVPDLDGLESHVQQIMKTVAEEMESSNVIRTILDINCGLSRLSDHRVFENSTILCLAPYEVNGSQVQYALERGYPAMIGSFLNTQLPFPSSSFDMIHAMDSDFDWTWKENLILLELDRLLKPGGFFIWSFQVMMPPDSLMVKHGQDWQVNRELAIKVCWSIVLEAAQTHAWKKTGNQSCYSSRGFEGRPKLCGKLPQVNAGWYPPLRPCITIVNNSAQSHLPGRHLGVVKGFSNEELSNDSGVWSAIVKSYWSLLTPLIFSDHPKRPGEEDPLPPSNIVRNIMDMNAVHGRLNSALLDAKKSVWVMNVVPHTEPDALSTILEQGLIGVQHDWCDAFPTYPRTYDLLHGIGLLSQHVTRSNGCGLSNLFLEMDRILRPEGWVILRDRAELIEDARIAAGQMKWESRIIDVEGLEDQQLLVCQKIFWKNPSSKTLSS